MRRPLSLIAAIVAGVMAVPLPAEGKFNVRLVITGPGLAAPVELLNAGIEMGCLFSRSCRPASRAPERRLGPRYAVTQFLEGADVHGPMMDRIAHDVYPYARGGPLVFTPAGQTWHAWDRTRPVPSGWAPAPGSLIRTLRARGLPADPRAERADRASSAEATGRPGRGTVGGLVGVGVLLTGGLFLGRVRRRNRSPGP